MNIMAKKRIVILLFHQIYLIAICCQLATATSQTDCRQLHVHYDTSLRLTGKVIQTGGNRQIILNCSVVGSYNKNNIKKFQFNDNQSYSCSKSRRSKAPKDGTNTSYTRLLDDGTTCQLIVPKPTKDDFINYRCSVKFRLCYLWSETTIPYENVFTTTLSGESPTTIPPRELLTTTDSGDVRDIIPDEIFITQNDSSNTVTKIEAFVIGGILLVSLIATVIVVKAMKYSCQRVRRQPPNEVCINNQQLFECLLNAIQQREGDARNRPQHANGNNHVNGNNFNDNINYGARRDEPDAGGNQGGGNDDNPGPNIGNNRGNGDRNDPNGDDDGGYGADNNRQAPLNNEENNNQENREVQEVNVVHSGSSGSSSGQRVNDGSGVSSASGANSISEANDGSRVSGASGAIGVSGVSGASGGSRDSSGSGENSGRGDSSGSGENSGRGDSSGSGEGDHSGNVKRGGNGSQISGSGGTCSSSSGEQPESLVRPNLPEPQAR